MSQSRSIAFDIDMYWHWTPLCAQSILLRRQCVPENKMHDFQGSHSRTESWWILPFYASVTISSAIGEPLELMRRHWGLFPISLSHLQISARLGRIAPSTGLTHVEPLPHIVWESEWSRCNHLEPKGKMHMSQFLNHCALWCFSWSCPLSTRWASLSAWHGPRLVTCPQWLELGRARCIWFDMCPKLPANTILGKVWESANWRWHSKQETFSQKHLRCLGSRLVC